MCTGSLTIVLYSLPQEKEAGLCPFVLQVFTPLRPEEREGKRERGGERDRDIHRHTETETEAEAGAERHRGHTQR